jgi:hypothetical protein
MRRLGWRLALLPDAVDRRRNCAKNDEGHSPLHINKKNGDTSDDDGKPNVWEKVPRSAHQGSLYVLAGTRFCETL